MAIVCKYGKPDMFITMTCIQTEQKSNKTYIKNKQQSTDQIQ